MKLVITTVGFVAACAAGCASTPVPNAKVASTESTVQSARTATAGAGSVPEADQHLRRADDELAKARVLIRKGDNDEASAMLSRADADARLAAALSHEAQQRRATDSAVQRVISMPGQSAPAGPNR
jgi:hypothetical protein